MKASPFDLIKSGPVLDDLDAGKLSQDPALSGVVGELGLFRLEPLVHCDDAFELFDICAGVERHPFKQPENRGKGVNWWRGQKPLDRPLALLCIEHEVSLLLHQNSSFPTRAQYRPAFEAAALRDPLIGPGVMLVEHSQSSRKLVLQADFRDRTKSFS